jgi:hypothetical protein
LTVVLAALLIALLVSAVLTRQISELAVDLPKYQATVNAKIVKLRDAAADNALFGKVSAALKNSAKSIRIAGRLRARPRPRTIQGTS